ncbi:MAG: glycoside hydrolase family 44 protein [Thermoanaerobaculia bacterium]
MFPTTRETLMRATHPSRFAMLLVAILACAAGAGAQDLWVYDNALASGFEDWSWATRNIAASGDVHSVPAAISWEPDNWQGLFFHSNAGFDCSDYLSLRLWVKGVGGSGQQIDLSIQLDNGSLATVDLENYVAGGGISSSQWREAVLPFAALGLTNCSFNELVLQAGTGANQPEVRVDDIRFLFDPTPPAAVSVAVDPALDRRAISDLVYGVNFASPAQLAAIGYPLNRWGGNRTTRYNWQLDVDNSAADWFFTNYTADDSPENLPADSAADDFVRSARAADAEVILTLPTIGRVAGPDRERRWGFSQGLYGPQLQDECDLGAPEWCNPDAGNGRCTLAANPLHCNAAGRIIDNEPDDTTVEVQTSFLTEWVTFVASRVGASSQGGVRYFALDNEPMLWNSTHSDIHPQPPTYNEVWSRGLAVAQAVKAYDSRAQILGPDTWGWCDLWTSASDAAGGVSCIDGPDRAAHGGLPFVAWYLAQSCAHLASTGVRPIDFLDVHYYPQSGEAFGGEAYAALRLQSTRELWDPAYTSASWIGDEVALIPRLRAWIDTHCAGTRIALTEYSWGADAAPSGALAQAEILAIFGREGVDLATRWVVPASGTKTEEAFKLFLNYDGAGANAFGDRVRAQSSDAAQVGAFAIRGHSDELVLLLFNKGTAEREIQVTVNATLAGNFDLHRFTATTPLGPAGSAIPAGGVLTLTLPARSATLARGRLATNLIFQDRFETSTWLGWSAVAP